MPEYYSHYSSPVKVVELPDGGLFAWRLNAQTGSWRPANNLHAELVGNVGGEVDPLDRDEFIQLTEWKRARHLRGDGPVFALYETAKAIEDQAESERRPLTDSEWAMVKGLRRRTYAMFEKELASRGEPGADPSPQS